jgi:hypothetical protein
MRAKSRTARIKELMRDEGMSRKEALAWVDFEGDYQVEQRKPKAEVQP